MLSKKWKCSSKWRHLKLTTRLAKQGKGEKESGKKFIMYEKQFGVKAFCILCYPYEFFIYSI